MIAALRSVCLYDSLAATVLDKNLVAADGVDKAVLDYAIGEGGTGLSGGEGQRLSLARVFLRRPKSLYSMKALQVSTEIPPKEFFSILKNTQRMLEPALSTFPMKIV